MAGILGAVLCVILLGIAGYLFWLAAKPQRHVAGIRKRMGIDLLANVRDQKTYFGFVRRKFAIFGVLIFLVTGWLGYSTYLVQTTVRPLFGGATAGEYIETRKNASEKVREMGKLVDEIIEDVEQAKADGERAPNSRDAGRQEALEALKESAKSLKATIERAEN